MKLFGHRTPSAAAFWFSRTRSTLFDAADDLRWSHWLLSDDAHMVHYENLELAWEISDELRHRPQVEHWLQAIDRRPAGLANTRDGVGARRLRPFWLGGAVAAMILAAAIVALVAYDRPMTAEYATAIGEQKKVTLADGSIVTLNTATRLTLQFSRGVRRVDMEAGEADFLVFKDAQRPFEVHALRGVTTAVGTEFDVELSPAGATVSVLNGIVQVQASQDAHLQISAGQAVNYTSEGALSAVAPANTNRVRAWQARRVVFNDLPLHEALAEYNRYLSIPIIVGDPALAAKHINGVFGVDNSAAFLDALQQTLHVKVTASPSNIRLDPG